MGLANAEGLSPTGLPSLVLLTSVWYCLQQRDPRAVQTKGPFHGGDIGDKLEGWVVTGGNPLGHLD